MNQIRLEIIIDRSNQKQRLIQFFRHGHGDDMVEHAADYLERVLENGVQELIDKSGGGWDKPPVMAEVTIKVNGSPRIVSARKEISYEEVCGLAGHKPDRGLTVVYFHRLTDIQGMLTPGKKVALFDGMVFEAHDTSNA